MNAVLSQEGVSWGGGWISVVDFRVGRNPVYEMRGVSLRSKTLLLMLEGRSFGVCTVGVLLRLRRHI